MQQKRSMIEVDEELCDGCGQCVTACHEGALRVVDGKARIVAESLCDGLGACLGDCPRGALKIIEREAEPLSVPSADDSSKLSHWPVQIRLVSPQSPFLQEASLVVAADCVPVAFPGFHRQFVDGHAVLIGCPKFDDLQDYTQRFARIFAASSVREVTVLVMQVPCCRSLPMAVVGGLEMAGKKIPVERLVIGVNGEVLERKSLNFV